jgi:hypothetical protein
MLCEEWFSSESEPTFPYLKICLLITVKNIITKDLIIEVFKHGWAKTNSEF